MSGHKGADYHCIREPDDRCIDCSPNCPNSDTFDQERKPETVTQKPEAKKWRDPDGNVYSVEQSVKNKRFVVIRTNAGGNRKAAKHLPVGNAAYVQKELDAHAAANGWTGVIS